MRPTPAVRSRLVVVYTRGEKAYLPTQARLEQGGYLSIEPVRVIDLALSTLAAALGEALASENPRRPSLTREEFKAYKPPTLKATGFRSWKQFAREASAYTLEIHDDVIDLRATRLDKKGVWEYDDARERHFPSNTDPRQIAEAIIEDSSSFGAPKPAT